ncbi:unnamed protein product [Discosporangium mesarthrocarpum]
MHYHISAFGVYRGPWARAVQSYERIMASPASIHYVTLIRQPWSHYLSYYYYYKEPQTQVPITRYLEGDGVIRNPLASEFGLRSKQEVNEFIEKYLPGMFVILTDRFDEGLVLLKRMLGWELIDMTYSVVMETDEGVKRYDGKTLKRVPKFDDLPKKVQTDIKKHTWLDSLLYQGAKRQYEKYLEVDGPALEPEVLEFQALQEEVNGYLDSNSTTRATKWYRGNVQCYGAALPTTPF